MAPDGRIERWTDGLDMDKTISLCLRRVIKICMYCFAKDTLWHLQMFTDFGDNHKLAIKWGFPL